MIARPTRLRLYRGDLFLGDITPTHNNFPWHYGSFKPSSLFHTVAELFEAELRALEAKQGESDWDKAYDLISSPGLRLEPIDGGNIISNPLIHIQEGLVWWR